MKLTRTMLAADYSDSASTDLDLCHERALRRVGWHEGIPVRRYTEPGQRGQLCVWEADIPVWRIWIARLRTSAWLFALRHRWLWVARKVRIA